MIEYNLAFFPCYCCAFGVISNKLSPIQGHDLLLCFIVLLYFELEFLYIMWGSSHVHMWCPALFGERLFPSCCLGALVENHSAINVRLISQLSILFHQSMCVLELIHSVYCKFEIGKHGSLNLFFLFKFILAILGLLHFHMNFPYELVNSLTDLEKNKTSWDFTRDYIVQIHQFGSTDF